MVRESETIRLSCCWDAISQEFECPALLDLPEHVLKIPWPQAQTPATLSHSVTLSADLLVFTALQLQITMPHENAARGPEAAFCNF